MYEHQKGSHEDLEEIWVHAQALNLSYFGCSNELETHVMVPNRACSESYVLETFLRYLGNSLGTVSRIVQTESLHNFLYPVTTRRRGSNAFGPRSISFLVFSTGPAKVQEV